MRVEVVTTGDEVMAGVIVDTNTAWIAARLAAMGHEVVRHESVADDPVAIADVCRAAVGRADAVVVTGGLGPTADDLTVEAAAGAFGVPLVMNENVLKGIRSFIEARGRKMASSNEKQALIPEGGHVLPNPVGTAPGIRICFDKTEFFFLPGVPKELYPIFDTSVAPWFEKHAGGSHRERVLRCFGCPEATIANKIEGIDFGTARLSFRVHFPEVLLKLVARAPLASDAEAAVARGAAAIAERLGDIVYAEGDEELPAVVGRLLQEQGMTLAVAESCTGGLIADLITDVPGASAWFERGLVTYSNRAKQELLGVGEETLAAHGAVSAQVVAEMAGGLREMSGADVTLAVTGIAGPSGGSEEKPVGTVHIGLAASDGVQTQAFHYPSDRVAFKRFIAWRALDMVRKAVTRNA